MGPAGTQKIFSSEFTSSRIIFWFPRGAGQNLSGGGTTAPPQHLRASGWAGSPAAARPEYKLKIYFEMAGLKPASLKYILNLYFGLQLGTALSPPRERPSWPRPGRPLWPRPEGHPDFRRDGLVAVARMAIPAAARKAVLAAARSPDLAAGQGPRGPPKLLPKLSDLIISCSLDACVQH